jgi:hypothetical protein
VKFSKIWRDVKERKLFLRWVLVNGLFALGIIGAKLSYHGHIHSVGQLAIAGVLSIYVVTAAYCGVLAWQENLRGSSHISLAIDLCPMVALLGTTGGFLIAFGAATSDIQHRVLGASTGLASTFVGIACAIILMINRHLLRSGIE